MKISIERLIEIDDVSMEAEILPSALLRIFQDSAIYHSTQVGYPTQWFTDNQQVWVLKEIAYKMHSPVKLHDHLTILTWTRGLEKIRGSREFKILRGNEHVISASSTWIYVDSRRRRPMRIHPEMFDAFKTDPDIGLEKSPDISDTFTDSEELSYSLAINYRDFDMNGHVNNTVYASYLQSAVRRVFKIQPSFESFSIDHKKEIRSDVTDVDVVLKRNGNLFAFEIKAEDVVRAVGLFGLRG